MPAIRLNPVLREGLDVLNLLGVREVPETPPETLAAGLKEAFLGAKPFQSQVTPGGVSVRDLLTGILPQDPAEAALDLAIPLEAAVSGGARVAGRALSKPTRTLFRGTNPGDLRRIPGTGQGTLFAAVDEKTARAYGKQVEKITLKPDAKILQEGTRDFAQAMGSKDMLSILRKRGGKSNLFDVHNEVIERAKSLGYDGMEAQSKEIGVSIFNPKVIQSREVLRKPGQVAREFFEKDIGRLREQLPGDVGGVTARRIGESKQMLEKQIPRLGPEELARLDRAVEQGYTIPAFHGTKGDITAFDPGLRGQTTGAPSARQGFFFAADPQTAESYARLADLEDVRPGVMAKAERASHEEFQDIGGKTTLLDHDVWNATGISGSSGSSLNEILAANATRVRQAAEEGIIDAATAKVLSDKVSKLKNRFDRAIKDRQSLRATGQNIMPVRLRLKDPLVHDFKGASYREVSYNDLLDQARREGRDGAIFRNTTDGGPVTDVYVVFEPENIRSPWAEFDPELAPKDVEGQVREIAGASIEKRRKNIQSGLAAIDEKIVAADRALELERNVPQVRVIREDAENLTKMIRGFSIDPNTAARLQQEAKALNLGLDEVRTLQFLRDQKDSQWMESLPSAFQIQELEATKNKMLANLENLESGGRPAIGGEVEQLRREAVPQRTKIRLGPRGAQTVTPQDVLGGLAPIGLGVGAAGAATRDPEQDVMDAYNLMGRIGLF